MKIVKIVIDFLWFKTCLLYSKFRWSNIWDMKAFLKDSTPTYKHSTIARCYDYILSQLGSWIGYNAEFEDVPYFPHGIMGCFISGGTKIGRNCVIYQQVTIGSNMLIDSDYMGSPTIGDNCLIGAGAKIIGKITIDNNVRIGAGAIVARDVPDNSVVIAQTRIIQRDKPLDNRFFTKREGRLFYWERNRFIEYKQK